ncbi:LIC_10190 family membrane protein [Psychroserpens jangbogonensis]|uniref:LIC_10190 family membrane protein n=1 Tax=Psychroserpens jangbogonensis TaxID=1484460 RepID=UPI00053E4177|nr:hypothetical protein [Psychroserpens jangbogonensis]
MIIYLFYSILCFSIIFAIGFSFLSLTKLDKSSNSKPSFLVIYFTGLLILSVVTSYLSIIIPANKYLTISYAFIAVIGIFKYRKQIKNYVLPIKNLSIFDYLIIGSIIIFLMIISSRGIYNYDSGLYHVQSIKWIDAYPVVSGLGNLHSRLAYNSLFFTLSSVFTMNGVFNGYDIVLFPLNTICLTVFLIWEYFNLKSYIQAREFKRVGFVIAIVLLMLSFCLKWLSSASPDIICAIMIIITLQKISMKKCDTYDKSFFIIALVSVCITFKLSSLFLFLVVLLFIRKKSIVADTLKIGVFASVIFLPFLIRNYYLSGYLIFPFSGLDIFSPDWKVPITRVLKEEYLIEAWAKIPKQPYSEVLSLGLTDWFPIWIRSKAILIKLLFFASCSTLFIGIIQCIRKRFISFKICMVLFANFLFWFFRAPDPRFAYGFLFFSFAYFIYFVVDLMQKKIHKTILGVFFIALTFSLTISSIKSRTLNTLSSYKNNLSVFMIPRNFIFSQPMQFEKVETNFEYFIPKTGDRCYNYKFPCTPYPKDELILRGKHLKDGFRLETFSANNK